MKKAISSAIVPLMVTGSAISKPLKVGAGDGRKTTLLTEGARKMPDREKLIELVAEAEEHSIDICVYNSDCEDCPGRKYGNKCREYLKADHLISHGVTVRERGQKVTVERHRGVTRYIPCPYCSHAVPSNKPYTEKVEYCSVCGKKLDDTFQNFCPNCGADMRTKGEGEEDA